MRYKTRFALEDIGIYDTLSEAIGVLMAKVAQEIEKGGMEPQMLETACWVEPTGRLPIMFYTARDIAIDEGWMVSGTGEWLADPITIPE